MLGAALALTVALGVLGSGVEERLAPASLEVPGTPSARAAGLLRAHFGDSAPFAIYLRGPKAAIDTQGPALLRALHRDPKLSTLSPWDASGLKRLRPSPRKALVLADFHLSPQDAVKEAVPELEATLAKQIHPPVVATQTSYATLSRAIQESSISSTEKAELLAIPFLALVLLLVFRSPVAALIPLGLGALTVLCARGGLFIASHWLRIDAFSLTVASMMGLALGVDYALLMVSRFREELAEGKDPYRAALSTRRTAGRTTLFAGTTLFASMLVSVVVLPGSLLLSLAGTAIMVTAIAVLGASHVAPALLCLLGERVNSWQLGSAKEPQHTLLHRSLQGALRRPALLSALIGGALLLLAVPALAVKTGPPSARQLPASDPARKDSETVAQAIGAGWDAPFLIAIASEGGPLTAKGKMREVASFQRLLEAQPGVVAVTGPAQVAQKTKPLAEKAAGLLGKEGEERLHTLNQLGPKLALASAGVGKLRQGVSQAASGAGLLGEGSRKARGGAAKIATALAKAAGAGAKAGDATKRLASGASRLAEGQKSAHAASLSLALGLHDLLPQLRKGSLARARKLRAQLAGDPKLHAQANALVLALAGARSEVRALRSQASALNGGMGKLAAGGEKLAQGTERLADAAAPLGGGLRRLGDGSSRLAAGLGRLQGGTETLASGLSEGYARSAPLQGGLGRAGERVSSQTGELSHQRQELIEHSPHLFDSGYFTLAALDGSAPSAREGASQAIDLSGGGGGGAIAVVSRYGLNTPGSEALDRHLTEMAERFEERSGLRAGVAGGPAQLTDYNHITRTRVPLVIAAMALVTFLALVVILRALWLAALATALNLLTVGVAFGVLVLLFDVPPGWPLGGHDYIDAIGAAGIFGIVFGLSVDYAVFLLARMREAYEETGDHRHAISFGLNRTAAVITGAAAIMIAVFACFAAAPIATVSQLGVGLTVAVALDATVVRIVLLPALMLLIGERVWWLPAPLERALPRIELHPA